jgi:hypothetical protein
MRSVRDADVIIQELTAARAEVLAAIEGLDDEQVAAPGDDLWSIKDHLGHLTTWDEMRFFEISRIARGGRPALTDVSDERIDLLNDIASTPRRAIPLLQVLEDMEFARALVLDAISHAPEVALDEKRYGEISLQGAADHDRGHAEAIRRIREKVSG